MDEVLQQLARNTLDRLRNIGDSAYLNNVIIPGGAPGIADNFAELHFDLTVELPRFVGVADGVIRKSLHRRLGEFADSFQKFDDRINLHRMHDCGDLKAAFAKPAWGELQTAARALIRDIEQRGWVWPPNDDWPRH